ncbi:MAG: segregation/condensation protein A [Acidimicrobiales bacterium]
MSFQVQTEAFEGPFDLLLHLILKDEVDLYDISLSRIVDAYLAELDRMDRCDLEVATEFLLIAATLIELKCRRLLPVDADVDLDEELGLWEERDYLLSRLLECKTFKDAAKVLEQLAQLASLVAPRRVGVDDRFLDLAPDLLAGVSPQHLHDAFVRVASPRPVPTVALHHVTQIRVSVTDAIERLITDLPSMGVMSFRQITRHCLDRVEVVVNFLAVLELFKQGLVEIEQVAVFGTLTVEWIGGNVGVDDYVMATTDTYEG